MSLGVRLASLAAAAGFCAVGPSAGAVDALVSDDWQFQLTPYFWALAMDGDVTVKGVKTSPSVSFDEIFDDLDYALMIEGEARKGRFGIYANAIYADLGTTAEGDGIRAKADAQTAWAGAGGFYRLGPWPLGAEADGPKLAVDPYAGFRYTYLDTELRIRDGGPQVSASESWVDPVIGIRTLWQLTPKWTVTALGDIGGFGVGADFTWQAAGLLGYRFGLFGADNARIQAGYRALYQDYKSGNGDDEFKWDMTLHGPTLALAIDF